VRQKNQSTSRGKRTKEARQSCGPRNFGDPKNPYIKVQEPKRHAQGTSICGNRRGVERKVEKDMGRPILKHPSSISFTVLHTSSEPNNTVKIAKETGARREGKAMRRNAKNGGLRPTNIARQRREGSAVGLKSETDQEARNRMGKLKNQSTQKRGKMRGRSSTNLMGIGKGKK